MNLPCVLHALAPLGALSAQIVTLISSSLETMRLHNLSSREVMRLLNFELSRKRGFSIEQVPVSAYDGSLKHLKDLKDLEVMRLSRARNLHRRAKRDPKAKMLYLQSFLRKGVSLGYVGRI